MYGNALIPHAEVFMLEIKEVKSRRDLKVFVNYPNHLYKNDPYYVPGLLMEEMKTLDKKKNPAFAFSDGAYFMAYEGNRPVGRIGVLVNHKYNEKMKQKRARFTHVDFIDDRKVSALLFETAERWARERGYDALHGPLGLTDLDHQGMLVEGFQEMDLFLTIYNHEYYPRHLEDLGYRKDVDWIEYQVTVPKEPNEYLAKLAKRVKDRYGYRLVEFRNKKDLLSWAQKVFDLYNEAYAPLYGMSALNQEQIDMYIKAYFSYVNPDFIKFIVNEQNEMVGFGITLPSLSKAMRKTGGRLFPFGFLTILKAIRRNDVLDMYLVAIHPKHQKTGANALMIDSVLREAIRYGIRYAETGPELEENKQVHALWKLFDTRQHRRRRVYVKSL